MKKRTVGLTKRRALYGYIFILPFIIGFIFFMLKPLVQSLSMSFSSISVGPNGFQSTWCGIENFNRS